MAIKSPTSPPRGDGWFKANEALAKHYLQNKYNLYHTGRNYTLVWNNSANDQIHEVLRTPYYFKEPFHYVNTDLIIQSVLY